MLLLMLLLLLLQGMDGSGGWGNFSGVAADSSGWVTQLWDNMKAGTMMIRSVPFAGIRPLHCIALSQNDPHGSVLLSTA
jgi:hypothetical protein